LRHSEERSDEESPDLRTKREILRFDQNDKLTFLDSPLTRVSLSRGNRNMETARVIEITRFGPPEVLKVREEPIPEIEAEEVLICVKAIGLNFADIFERLGLYKAAPKAPFVPGFEVAGIIEKVGPGVLNFKPGQRVMAVTRFGAYKTYLKVNHNFIRVLPADFSFEEGAGFPTTYLTAYHGLFNLGHLRRGEKVLIHAAAGGVGTAAIQLAQIYDAEIFATCGSEAKVDFLKNMGIRHAINYKTHDFEKEIRQINQGGGVDVIMDSVGGSTFRKGYRLLNPMGRLVIFGLGSMMPSGKRPNWFKLAFQYVTLPRFSPFNMMPENKTIAAFHLAYMFERGNDLREAFDTLLKWAYEGRLRTVVGKVFPFEQAAEAQDYLQSRKSIGKVILKVE
jgi:NADPH:quinone reductase-like Zn-dependent oxidoreductase